MLNPPNKKADQSFSNFQTGIGADDHVTFVSQGKQYTYMYMIIDSLLCVVFVTIGVIYLVLLLYMCHCCVSNQETPISIADLCQHQ